MQVHELNEDIMDHQDKGIKAPVLRSHTDWSGGSGRWRVTSLQGDLNLPGRCEEGLQVQATPCRSLPEGHSQREGVKKRNCGQKTAHA